MRSRIVTIATYLPKRVLSNADLEAENPDWNMPRWRNVVSFSETGTDRGRCPDPHVGPAGNFFRQVCADT